MDVPHTTWTDPQNTTPDPLPVARDGVLYLIPRHMDEELLDLAATYGGYAVGMAVAEARGGPDAPHIETERMRRWDDLLDYTAPKFTNRADALAFVARLTHAINTTWPA